MAISFLIHKCFLLFLINNLCNFSTVFSTSLKGENSTLHAVVVLFRHGDRNPESSWPNDPYFSNITLWPEGYGELTNKGKNRHYDLGKWLRTRYSSFLPSGFNASDIYVRSTDVDRTIMSAQANLAGLYYPERDQIWNDEVMWQPVPVHTFPLDSDCILSAEIPCPKHDNLQNKVFSDYPELQKIVDRYQDVTYNLSILTGYDPNNFNIYSVSGVYSTLSIYKGRNFTLPQWATDYKIELSYLTGVKFSLPTFSMELARLRTGPFFDYLKKHFEVVKNKVLGLHKGMAPKENTKFLMLSAHDTTLADVMNSLGAYNNAPIEFGTVVIWELRSINKDNEFFLNFYLKNSSIFEELTIKTCRFDCKLSDFNKLIEPLAIDKATWEKECGE